MKKINYSVDFGRRKNFYITVTKGEVLVKAPFNATMADVERIVAQKSDWIISNIQKTLENMRPDKIYSDGNVFYILGEKCVLCEKITDYSTFCMDKVGSKLYVYIPREFTYNDNSVEIEKCFQKWFSDFSKKEIMESFYRLQKLTGFKVNKVTIRKMTKSWGRCSSNGNISINRTIAEYDKKGIDYVIIHELCHTVYFNHSKELWNHVGRFMPDYKIWREKIKG